MRFYGNREPGKDVYEISGRFSKNGRWFLTDTVNEKPTDSYISALKNLSGFKYMKADKTH